MIFMKDKNEKDLTESVVCREITQEILKFGVNQAQIRKIIKLLALELDDNALMKQICQSVGDDSVDSVKTKLTF